MIERKVEGTVVSEKSARGYILHVYRADTIKNVLAARELSEYILAIANFRFIPTGTGHYCKHFLLLLFPYLDLTHIS